MSVLERIQAHLNEGKKTGQLDEAAQKALGEKVAKLVKDGVSDADIVKELNITAKSLKEVKASLKSEDDETKDGEYKTKDGKKNKDGHDNREDDAK